MIICSSSIGMESVNYYTSVRMDANLPASSAGKAISSFLQSLGDANARLADKESEKDDESKETTTADNLESTLADIRNRYDSMKTGASSLSSKLDRDTMMRIRVQCVQYLLMMLFGRRPSPDDEYGINEVHSLVNSGPGAGSVISYSTQEFTSFSYHAESEETTFDTVGKVTTADGRSIDFNLSLSMSRSFTEYYEQNYDIVTAMCDPLVINLDGNIAEVSDVKIKFDLDADGIEDEISRLSSNSGYLALDLNNDGRIGDGSELFGTASGNGFKDLAAYDKDGNGWIDEADDVWNRLKILVYNEDGSESLYSLSEKDVGAIFLGAADTGFTLTEQNTGKVNAEIRQTGIFLYENGSVGTIQHIDLAKAEYSA